MIARYSIELLEYPSGRIQEQVVDYPLSLRPERLRLENFQVDCDCLIEYVSTVAVSYQDSAAFSNWI